jgi:hypothetical protein
MINLLKPILCSALIFLGVSSVSADEKISAYLIGAHVQENLAKTKLQDVGFDVIASYSPVEGGTTLVFTNTALKAEAAKPKRSHAAILRMFIDNKEKTISITNPIYFGKAFMQDDYVESVFVEQKNKINQAFPSLKGSLDNLESDDIAGFHFMMGMPYYEDSDELAEATNDELLAKAKQYENGKSFIFELKLSDDSILVGYELDQETKKFIEKTGRANGAVLPYCISIEDGVASSLAAKYYLAVSYPQLTMGEFMTISDIPGAIEADLKKPFN